MGVEGGELKGVMKERIGVFAGGRVTDCVQRQCVEWKRCWRGWCSNLLRERPEIWWEESSKDAEKRFGKSDRRIWGLDVSGGRERQR